MLLAYPLLAYLKRKLQLMSEFTEVSLYLTNINKAHARLITDNSEMLGEMMKKRKEITKKTRNNKLRWRM